MKNKVKKALDIVRFNVAMAVSESPAKPVTPTQTAKLWLKKLNSKPLPPVKGRILITALRNRTWIEWGFYCAVLARQYGFETTVLVDGELLTLNYPGAAGNFFKKMQELPGLEIVDLAKLATEEAIDPKWTTNAKEWVNVALAYDLHLEEDDIANEPERYKELSDKFVNKAAMLATALDKYLSTHQFDRCICYSGIIGESKLLLDVLQDKKIYTITVENWGWRPGHMIYNINAPALEYNTVGWMNSLGEWDEKKESEINSLINFIDFDSKEEDWLNNYYRIQKDKVTDELPPKVREFVADDRPIFTLATNVIGDSSTLRRESIFSGQKAWLKEVIEWFVARPHLKLILRAHPGEIWMGGKCVQYMGAYAEQFAKGAENILIVHGNERLNSFSLIPFTRVGLVWLSSIGADFVVRGLPTLVAAIPKYTGLGIVEEPKTREEYFAILERWSEKVEKPNKQQVQAAKRYLHMVFKGFSFESQGPAYRAMTNLMDGMPNQEEHDKFYRIMFGIEPPVEATVSNRHVTAKE